MKFLLFVFIFLHSLVASGQDMVTKGDIADVTAFKLDMKGRFSFGKNYYKQLSEDNEQFVQRVLGKAASIHHGAFLLKGFNNCIVSFGSYKFKDTDIVLGILFESVGDNNYRLLKMMELSSGCGDQPEIKSVFLYEADTTSLGPELIVHASDYCGSNGVNNYVYIYNKNISNSKLSLTTMLSERCDYSEVKLDGEWDIDMGEQDVERRYVECNYTDHKTIKQKLTKDLNLN